MKNKRNITAYANITSLLRHKFDLRLVISHLQLARLILFQGSQTWVHLLIQAIWQLFDNILDKLDCVLGLNMKSDDTLDVCKSLGTVNHIFYVDVPTCMNLFDLVWVILEPSRNVQIQNRHLNEPNVYVHNGKRAFQ